MVFGSDAGGCDESIFFSDHPGETDVGRSGFDASPVPQAASSTAANSRLEVPLLLFTLNSVAACILRMAKYKAVKKKKPEDKTPQMRPGAPCLVIVVIVILVIAFVMYFAMKNAG